MFKRSPVFVLIPVTSAHGAAVSCTTPGVLRLPTPRECHTARLARRTTTTADAAQRATCGFLAVSCDGTVLGDARPVNGLVGVLKSSRGARASRSHRSASAKSDFACA